MLKSTYAANGMVVAPHHLAAESGHAVLREGGNALEAMIAAAASIAVVYPHMNSIGGDGFWVISPANSEPIAIDACGAAGTGATIERYSEEGLDAVPSRGPLAALTVAGTISGWGMAKQMSDSWGGTLPLERLLADAVGYARDGVAVTEGQVRNTTDKLPEMGPAIGFKDVYTPGGSVPKCGDIFRQLRLASTLEQIGRAGTEDFYRGDLAQAISADLAEVGSPVHGADLTAHQAKAVTPLSLRVGDATVYNMRPPTQGLASLLILGVFAKMKCAQADGFDFVHLLVEASKQAFAIRDQYVTDEAYMSAPPESFLTDEVVAKLAAGIDPQKASDWKRGGTDSDTIWMGTMDRHGNSVSFIQSVYWEFGSGVVLPKTGITWQNRGASFALDPEALNPLQPGRKPFHTLNPAMARLDDGRVMLYGTMGGEGQPQTQAAVFNRIVRFGQPVQAAITAPRWLLGRTWGSDSTNLKIESRFPDAVIEALRVAGQDVEVVEGFSDLMGHAGALVRRPDGLIEAGFDPRSDGAARGF
ncbi:MAG: gamma-glutamyltransferase family protein [Alphaproteobacteria bacterium]|nr:gamma-glutamyltransferase family protein [Alphaproteobacteria bacterium]